MIHYQNAKWIARTVLSFALWTICLPGRASDVPGQNEQGEFIFGERREWVTTWRVMDRTGLNCRMAERFMGITYADAGAPDSLYANFTHEIGSWPVVSEFSYREDLNAQTANLRNPNILYDRKGNAWMAVDTKSPGYSHLMCFVRANSDYILPVSKDQFRKIDRYGLLFPEAIGYWISPDGSTIPLFYSQVKIDADNR